MTMHDRGGMLAEDPMARYARWVRERALAQGWQRDAEARKVFDADGTAPQRLLRGGENRPIIPLQVDHPRNAWAED